MSRINLKRNLWLGGKTKIGIKRHKEYRIITLTGITIWSSGLSARLTQYWSSQIRGRPASSGCCRIRFCLRRQFARYVTTRWSWPFMAANSSKIIECGDVKAVFWENLLDTVHFFWNTQIHYRCSYVASFTTLWMLMSRSWPFARWQRIWVRAWSAKYLNRASTPSMPMLESVFHATSFTPLRLGSWEVSIENVW